LGSSGAPISQYKPIFSSVSAQSLRKTRNFGKKANDFNEKNIHMEKLAHFVVRGQSVQGLDLSGIETNAALSALGAPVLCCRQICAKSAHREVPQLRTESAGW
jgi:hypothetical protein